MDYSFAHIIHRYHLDHCIHIGCAPQLNAPLNHSREKIVCIPNSSSAISGHKSRPVNSYRQPPLSGNHDHSFRHPLALWITVSEHLPVRRSTRLQNLGIGFCRWRENPDSRNKMHWLPLDSTSEPNYFLCSSHI